MGREYSNLHTFSFSPQQFWTARIRLPVLMREKCCPKNSPRFARTFWTWWHLFDMILTRSADGSQTSWKTTGSMCYPRDCDHQHHITQGCVLFLCSSPWTPTAAPPATIASLLSSLQMFADDATLIGLIMDGDESAYRKEVDRLLSWCSCNNLELKARRKGTLGNSQPHCNPNPDRNSHLHCGLVRLHGSHRHSGGASSGGRPSA